MSPRPVRHAASAARAAALARLAGLAALATLTACAGSPARVANGPPPLAPEPAAAAVPAALPDGAEPDADADADAIEPPAPAFVLPDEAAALAALREAVVRSAATRAGRPFRGDCSGFVLAALRDARVRPRLPPAKSRSESLFLASGAVDRPRPGDLAFFHNTHDRNRDGRANDRFTHVALVESVEASAVVLLHRGGRGVQRVRMDLTRPDDPELNDPIRVRRRGDAPGVRTLAGELFAAFGALLPNEFTQMLHVGDAPETRARHRATR